MKNNFTGAKLAYILNHQLLVYKRDNIPHIPFPDMWDFPGGAREGDESPEDCVLRELHEEFGLLLDATRLVYKEYGANYNNTGFSYFFVAEGSTAEIARIQFGSEGQCWQLMGIDEFLAHPMASPVLKPRLQQYLLLQRP